MTSLNRGFTVVILFILLNISASYAQEYKVPGGVSLTGENSDVIDYDIPNKLKPGEEFPVSITIVNNGVTKWSKGENFYLKLYEESGQSQADIWGINKVDLPYDINPSDKVVLLFNIKAPQAAGTYNMKWAMARDYEFFGEYTSNAIEVVGEPVSAVTGKTNVNSETKNYNASFIRQDVPISMLFNQLQDISVTVRNSGDKTWIKGSEQLGFIDAKKSVVTLNLWNVGYIQLPNNVEPGESVVLSFQVKPIETGWQYFQCSMMKEDGTLFGTPSQSVEVNVTK